MVFFISIKMYLSRVICKNKNHLKTFKNWDDLGPQFMSPLVEIKLFDSQFQQVENYN